MRRLTAEMSQWRAMNGTGKNLFNKDTVVQGGYLSSSNTVISNASWSYSDYIAVKPNTMYTLYGQTIGIAPATCFYTANKTFISGVMHNNVKPKVFTTPANAAFARVSVQVNSLDKAQFEEGETATDYEPYHEAGKLTFSRCKGGYFSTLEDYALKVIGRQTQEGTPTPEAPIDIQCVKAGTKIRAGAPMTTVTAWINVSKQLSFSSDSLSVRLPVKSGTTYELYLDTSTTTLFRAGATNSEAMPETGAPIALSPCVRDNAPAHITLTTGAAAKYIWVQIAVGQRQAIHSLTVIDKSSGKTYKPFVVSEATVPCDMYEGDIFYPMTGRVERMMQVRVLDGTESWSQYATQAKRWQLLVGNKSYGRFACTHFPKDTAASGLITKDGYAKCVDGERIRFSAERFADVAEWKAWLAAQYAAGTPVTVAYELRAPIIEQYDPQPIFAPAGTVQVVQEAVELAAGLSATMLVRR